MPRIAALYRLLHLERHSAHNPAYSGEFKRLRGAEPAIEWHAVHTRHLPATRRAAYRALELLANGPGRRFLEGAGV